MNTWRDYLTDDDLRVHLRAVREAYDVTGDRYDESLGDNAMIHGTLVSNTAKHFVQQSLSDRVARKELAISRPSNSFQVESAACTFHYYKFIENVHSIKFDQSTTKAELASFNQLVLPFDPAASARNEAIKSAGEGEPPFVHLVFAHTGTPLDGLTQLWIGAPNGLGKDGVSPWAWVEKIYDVDTDGGRYNLPQGHPTPPPRTRALPDVVIRPRSTENEGEL